MYEEKSEPPVEFEARKHGDDPPGNVEGIPNKFSIRGQGRMR